MDWHVEHENMHPFLPGSSDINDVFERSPLRKKATLHANKFDEACSIYRGFLFHGRLTEHSLSHGKTKQYGAIFPLKFGTREAPRFLRTLLLSIAFQVHDASHISVPFPHAFGMCFGRGIPIAKSGMHLRQSRGFLSVFSLVYRLPSPPSRRASPFHPALSYTSFVSHSNTKHAPFPTCIATARVMAT